MKKPIAKKKAEIVRGFTIKYHVNGKTIWSKGKIKEGTPMDIGSGIELMEH